MTVNAYPVQVSEDDNGTYLVTFPDFPEAVTFGASAARRLQEPSMHWRPRSSAA